MLKISTLGIYIMLALLAGIVSCSAFLHSDRLTVFAQGEENASSSNADDNGHSNTTNSAYCNA